MSYRNQIMKKNKMRMNKKKINLYSNKTTKWMISKYKKKQYKNRINLTEEVE